MSSCRTQRRHDLVTCYGKSISFSSNLVIESSEAVQHPRVKTVFIRAIQNQDEIQRLYEESQERKGDEIAYQLRREVDMSSKYTTRRAQEIK